MTTGGMAITKCTVAVSTKYKDKEETAFVDVTMFDKRGENFAKFHRKGARAIIFGRLQQENWDDKATGAKRSKLSVICDDWVFAGGDKAKSSDPVSDNAGYSVAADAPRTISDADENPF